MSFEQETCAINNKACTLISSNFQGDKKQHLSASTDFQEVTQDSYFLLQYQYTKLHQIYFTQPGFFEKFQIALDHDPTYQWTDGDRSEFLRVWSNIEYAFHKSYGNSLLISAGDALVILLERFTFDQIGAMDTWVLARFFQILWKEFYQLSFPGMKLLNGVLQIA